MLKVWRAFFARRAHDERGSEFVGALFVFPVLFILIIGSIEIGAYVQTRMRVENIARDAVRRVAADGGNYNLATNTLGMGIDTNAKPSLIKNGVCQLSHCDPPGATINCRRVTDATGHTNQNLNRVLKSGDIVTCVVKYPYKQLSGGLMNGVMGLGIGGLMPHFTVEESARSETGRDG